MPTWRAPSARSPSSAGATRATSRWSPSAAAAPCTRCDVARGARHPARARAGLSRRLHRGRHARERRRASLRARGGRARSTALDLERGQCAARRDGGARRTPRSPPRATRGRQRRLEFQADLRYVGQASELVDPAPGRALLPPRGLADAPRGLQSRVRDDLRLRHRRGPRARQRARDRHRPPAATASTFGTSASRRAAAPRPDPARSVSFDRRAGSGGYAGAAAGGARGRRRSAGPLIIESYDSTVVVPPGARRRRRDARRQPRSSPCRDEARMRIDPITFAVIKSALDAVVDEMAYTVIRTARSEIIKDVMDYSAAICDAGGPHARPGQDHRPAPGRGARRHGQRAPSSTAISTPATWSPINDPYRRRHAPPRRLPVHADLPRGPHRGASRS